MENITLGSFNVVGIAIRTSNDKGQAAKDIPVLWERFISENIASQIPGRSDRNIYCVYTEYEGDFTQPYTTVLGCKVDQLGETPEGMKAIEIPQSSYQIFTARGRMDSGIVVHEWVKIWNSGLERAYVADFEIYGEKSRNPEMVEVDIYIGLK
jgi:predicted transcriptional regulator YdeE